MVTGATPSGRQLTALFAVSAVLLAFQVWTTRLIAIQHWHHLAPLVIAVALLGFGGGGVLVALNTHRVIARPRRWLLPAAGAIGLAVPAGAIVSTRVPLNMLALPWEFGQSAYLALYALCFLPAFLSGAVFVSACFVLWPVRAGHIYGVDLLGGACGALAVLPLVDALGIHGALAVLTLLPLGAASLLVRRAMAGIGVAIIAALAVLGGQYLLDIEPAEYKSQALRQAEHGSRIILQADGLSRRFTVVASPGMHAAPGLSLRSTARAPRQWQLFTDGENPVPLILPPQPPVPLPYAWLFPTVTPWICSGGSRHNNRPPYLPATWILCTARRAAIWPRPGIPTTSSGCRSARRKPVSPLLRRTTCSPGKGWAAPSDIWPPAARYRWTCSCTAYPATH